MHLKTYIPQLENLGISVLVDHFRFVPLAGPFLILNSHIPLDARCHIAPNGGMTRVYLHFPKDRFGDLKGSFQGFAVCAPSESYVRKLGILVALDKVLTKTMELGNPISDAMMTLSNIHSNIQDEIQQLFVPKLTE